MSKKDLDYSMLWILENQGITLDEKLVSEATKTAKRIMAAKDAALGSVPFGTEPSGFLLAFDQLASVDKQDDSR